MKIGIFGGSFNPPHSMHKSIAIQLIAKNYLDKVIFVPTGNKYSKNDLIDAKHRLEMLKMMIQNNESLLVSDYEVKKILTYTYQTLDYFKSIFPNDEIYFICGSDNLKDIKSWKNYRYILDNYKLLVVRRNNDEVSEIAKKLNSESIIVTSIFSQNISSTNIRNLLNDGKESNNLDVSVRKYIISHKLYGN